MKLVIAWILVLLVISIALVPHSFVNAKSKDSKAKDAIIKAIGKAVEGKYSTIKLIQLSKSNVSGYVITYNKTGGVPIPTPIPPPIPPNPTPPPTGAVTKVCLIGDLKGSDVPNKMKDCNLRIGLGDLGYQNDLSWFKGLKFDKCLQGNHESANEDGTSSIEKETQGYCGNAWKLKVGQSALFFGFNTNGNLDDQLTSAKQIPLNGIKTVFILSHKPCYTSPNSHHPVESSVKAFCDSLVKSFPVGIKVYYIAGHNHQMASTLDGTKFISGAGGKSHYDCGTDQLWNFCNNKDYGYLEVTIGNNTGDVGTKFIS